jgi:hypothetical protein
MLASSSDRGGLPMQSRRENLRRPRLFQQWDLQESQAAMRTRAKYVPVRPKNEDLYEPTYGGAVLLAEGFAIGSVPNTLYATGGNRREGDVREKKSGREGKIRFENNGLREEGHM